MSRITSWVRPHLLNLKPYSSARDEYTGTEGVFLDANENALGSVGGNGWNRYPDPYQSQLKDKVSKLKKIAKERIFLGNGSDEPIDLLIRAFCEPGKDKIAYLSPTYGMYKVSAGIHNIETVQIPLNQDFQIDEQGLVEEQLADVKIFFICSPNNPSGNLLDEKEVLRLIKRLDCLVVLDEAYIDFCKAKTLLPQLESLDHLVILQTFSKAWGLAAYRLGVAYAHPEVIDILNKIKAPYNLNGPIQELALQALENEAQVDEWVSKILTQKEWLVQSMKALPMVEKIYPSDANFLLVKFKNSASIFHFLIERKVIVRDRSQVSGCEGCLRITVGTEFENRTLLDTLEAYIKTIA